MRLQRKKVHSIGFRLKTREFEALNAIAEERNESISNLARQATLVMIDNTTHKPIGEQGGDHGVQGEPETRVNGPRHETVPTPLADRDAEPEGQPTLLADAQHTSAVAPSFVQPVQVVQPVQRSWGGLENAERVALFSEHLAKGDKLPEGFKTLSIEDRTKWLDSNWTLEE